MKNLKFFALIMAAIAFVACDNKSNDRNEIPNQNGSTYIAMKFSLKGNTRIDDSQADEAGRDAENKVSSLDLLGDLTKNWDETALTQTADQYTVAAWSVEPGQKKMGLMINKDASVAGANESATYGNVGEAAIASLSNVSSENKFLMSSKFSVNNVEPNIEEGVANAGTANNFSFDMERIVAQGQMYISATINKSGDNYVVGNTNDVILADDIKYATVNSGITSYVYLNNAGNRVMDDATGIYTNFKSAIDDFGANFSDLQDPAAVQDKLVRRGNIKPATGDLGAYAAVPMALTSDEFNMNRGVYFFENSVSKDKMTKENKDYGYYRLAYAKVYVTYSPEKVYKLDADGETLIEDDAYTPGSTFYMGEKDRRFYSSKEAAMKSTLDGAQDQNAYTYADGRCAYRVLWNRQTLTADPKVVVNADVRRNNIYLLEVEGFNMIGMPWDESDPDDPDLPKVDPTDPTDPVTPPDIETEETFMKVTAKVLKWNKVSRKVVLQ